MFVLLDKPFSNLKEQRTKLITGTQIVLAVHEMNSNKCVFGVILNKLDRIKFVLNIGDHCQYIHFKLTYSNRLPLYVDVRSFYLILKI